MDNLRSRVRVELCVKSECRTFTRVVVGRVTPIGRVTNIVYSLLRRRVQAYNTTPQHRPSSFIHLCVPRFCDPEPRYFFLLSVDNPSYCPSFFFSLLLFSTDWSRQPPLFFCLLGLRKRLEPTWVARSSRTRLPPCGQWRRWESTTWRRHLLLFVAHTNPGPIWSSFARGSCEYNRVIWASDTDTDTDTSDDGATIRIRMRFSTALLGHHLIRWRHYVIRHWCDHSTNDTMVLYDNTNTESHECRENRVPWDDGRNPTASPSWRSQRSPTRYHRPKLQVSDCEYCGEHRERWKRKFETDSDAISCFLIWPALDRGFSGTNWSHEPWSSYYNWWKSG